MARISVGGGNNGAAVRTARATTGSIAGSGTATVVVTLSPAFADLNYTVSAEVEEASATDSLRVRKVVSRTTSSVSVLVANQDTLTARTGTVHVLAVRD